MRPRPVDPRPLHLWVLAHRLLVPALVALLGRWNWVLPAPVRRVLLTAEPRGEP